MSREIGVRSSATRARYHRAGPAETEAVPGAEGAIRVVQRCLRCDRELVVVRDLDGSERPEVRVGRRIVRAPASDEGPTDDDLCPGRLE